MREVVRDVSPHTPPIHPAPRLRRKREVLTNLAKGKTMLTNTERATALKIVLSSHAMEEEEFGAINDRLCRAFPKIEKDDLISLWREAGERQLEEADELEKFARMRWGAALDA